MPELIRIDAATRQAWQGDRPLQLTSLTFDLLALLTREAGKVVTPGSIAREVWRTEWFRASKTIISHLSMLRKALGQAGADGPYLVTLRREGYRFDPDLVAGPGREGPWVRATRYEVSCLPEDDINAHVWTIAVEYRGRGLWAVLDGPFAYDADGGRDYEPRSSERQDEWLTRHRFDLDTALAIARREAPKKVVNGMTATGVLARRAAREAADALAD